MQPYQTFSNNNYPQFQPMYQPIQNPYMDRMQNLQSYQQPLQPQIQMQGLNGRIVDDFGNITANDVPMDNMGGIFLKKDGSEIQHKIWSPDGTIKTTSYLPFKDEKESNTSISSTNKEKTQIDAFLNAVEGISEKVDTLHERLDEFMKVKPSSRTRKEVSADE